MKIEGKNRENMFTKQLNLLIMHLDFDLLFEHIWFFDGLIHAYDR